MQTKTNRKLHGQCTDSVCVDRKVQTKITLL